MNHEKYNGNLNISSHFMAGKTNAKNMMQFDQHGNGQKESELVEPQEHIWLTISPSTLHLDSFFILILLVYIWFNSVILVSHVQQSDSVIYAYMYIYSSF